MSFRVEEPTAPFVKTETFNARHGFSIITAQMGQLRDCFTRIGIQQGGARCDDSPKGDLARLRYEWFKRIDLESVRVNMHTIDHLLGEIDKVITDLEFIK